MPRSHRKLRGKVELGKQMIPSLVQIIRVIHLPIIFPTIRLVVIVAVQSIGIDVRLHVEHQKRFLVVRHAISISIGIRETIVIFVLTQLHSIQVVIAAVVGESDQVADKLIDQAGVVVLQQEIPLEQNLRLAQRAKHLNTPVLFNLAPATHVPNALLSHVDWLVVNEVEATFLASSPSQEHIPHIAEQLANSNDFNVVVTQGPGTVIAVVDAQTLTFPAPAIQAVDTTGAGDPFVGYLAAGIAQGDTGTTHLERAVVAASRACTGLGAQTSIPFVDEVNLL